MGSRWILSRHHALLLHGWLGFIASAWLVGFVPNFLWQVVIFLGMKWSILGHACMHNYYDIHYGPNFDGGGGGRYCKLS